MSDLNEEWAIARFDGRWVVGKRTTASEALCPAYEFEPQVVQQGGAMQFRYMCWPMAMLPTLSARGVRVTELTPLSELTTQERRALRQAVEGVEGMIRQMKAAENGIHLVGH